MTGDERATGESWPEIAQGLEAMEAAADLADLIVALKPHYWPMCVVHLLEVLDLKLEIRQVGLGNAFLREVSVRLSNRFELGHWV